MFIFEEEFTKEKIQKRVEFNNKIEKDYLEIKKAKRLIILKYIKGKITFNKDLIELSKHALAEIKPLIEFYKKEISHFYSYKTICFMRYRMNIPEFLFSSVLEYYTKEEEDLKKLEEKL